MVQELICVTELREYIRLILTPNAKITPTTIENIGAIEAQAALTSAFMVALERRFPSPPPRKDIAALVAKIRADYVDSELLPPMLGEALARAAFGEESLLSEISDKDLAMGQSMMTYGLVHDLGLRDEAYEEFLTEAAEAAHDLLREMDT
jgi:hypothetical protein